MSVSSYGFSDFYRDASLPGHSLLEPSLWVIKTFEHVFSELDQDGCAAFCEVAKRIVLFVAASFTSILAFPVAVFGILVKGICYPCCSKNKETIDRQATIIHQPQEIQDEDEIAKNASPEQMNPTQNLLLPQVEIDSHPKLPIEAAQRKLREIRQQLSSIHVRKIDIGLVHQLKKELQSHQAINEVILNSATKTDEPGPAEKVAEETQILQLWIEELERLHDFYSQTIDERGVVEVANEGDCLFEALVFLSHLEEKIEETDLVREKQLNFQWTQENFEKNPDFRKLLLAETKKRLGLNSLEEAEPLALDLVKGLCGTQTFSDPLEMEILARRCNMAIVAYTAGKYERPEIFYAEKAGPGNVLFFKYLPSQKQYVLFEAQALRDEAVDWMRKNYAKHERLQHELVSSLTVHYLAKMEKLDQELKEISGWDESLAGPTKERQNAIKKELELIQTMKIDAITKARGGAHEPLNFGLVIPLLDEYFMEMARPGIYGGPAEIYAISWMQKRPIKVYSQRGSTEFGKEFKGPMRSLQYTGNHYNMYFPRSN